MNTDKQWIVSPFSLLSALILLLLCFYILRADSPKVDKDNSANIYAMVEKIAEPHGLTTTIKTIIYLESRNGVYPINLQDPACGITHININTYMRRHKLKDTPFNRNKACADLIASPEWAILNALQELLFWQKIHCSKGECTGAQYANVIKSYNAGWNYKGKKARDYYNRYKIVYKRLYSANAIKTARKD